ncbi:hypothetical protein SCHPADRAFT_662155 [Schizopora paradoxa]|uniref:Uncharacterized protein n=1 Tax=Schizopora paradoxa TaxID=27342 RepID=A0A0H2R712_9AGAM|nr:hypothetical protein SCHPADRAFT_662155 [Schizopora paradoxa]
MMDVEMRDSSISREADARRIEPVRSPVPSLKRDRESSRSSASISPRPISKETSRAPSTAPSNTERRSPQSQNNQEPTPPRSRSPPTPTQRAPAAVKSPSSPSTAPPNAKKQRLSPVISNGDTNDGDGDDDDYKSGIVVCGTCRARIPFRDPQTGAFSLKRWDAHREACKSSTTSASQTNGHGEPGTAPSSPPNPTRGHISPSAHMHIHPSSSAHHHLSSSSYHHSASSGPPRISDSPPPSQNLPQQQQKKRRAKRTERERIAYLASDPYVAEFEAYRVRCGACQRWIRLRPNSTYCSIPWDAHRRSCLAKRGGGAAAPPNGSNTGRKPLTTKSSLPMPHPMRRQDSYQSANSANDYDNDADADADGDEDAEGEEDDTVVSTAAYNNHRHYANGQVNGNGNSSSAYGRGHAHPGPPTSSSVSINGEGSEGDDPDAEGEIDDEAEYASTSQVPAAVTSAGGSPRHQLQDAARKSQQQQHAHPQVNGYSHSHTSHTSHGHHHHRSQSNGGSQNSHRNEVYARKEQHPQQQQHHQHHNSHGGHHQREHREHQQQQHDLGSRDGRLSFIALSIRHLFRTSYDVRAGDELTAMALVNYLNAALPMDKHEEFDLPEVTKAVAGALKERGIVKLEGDVVRLIG